MISKLGKAFLVALALASPGIVSLNAEIMGNMAEFTLLKRHYTLGTSKYLTDPCIKGVVVTHPNTPSICVSRPLQPV